MAFETSLVIKIDSKQAVAGARVAKGSLRQLSTAAKKTEGSFDRVRKSTRSMGLTMAKVAGSAALVTMFTQASKAALDFSTAMAEVSTLLPKGTDQMAALNEQALAMAVTFGSSPTEQAKALYQVISAGATTAAKQTEILTAANKLAVGGVTDIETAADGLTNILNAYGDGVKNATDVTDTMFVAMREGKTTIGEMSSSLGLVAPLAKEAGAKFTEVAATLATLTKGGINTRIAVTGLRAILAAVAKPSKEAADEAKKIGLNFSVAAIKAAGFAKFLDEVKRTTKGSTDSLAQLFGGVESLIPILRLAGSGSADFADIMEKLKDRFGETDEAALKVMNSIPQRLKVLKSEFLVFSTQVGESFNNFLVPALELVKANLGFVKNALVGLTAAFAFRTVIGMAIAFVKFARALTLAKAASIALTVAQNAGKAAFVVIAIIIAQITGGFDRLKDVLKNATDAAKEFVGPEAIAKIKEVLKAAGLEVELFDKTIDDLNQTMEQKEFGGGGAGDGAGGGADGSAIPASVTQDIETAKEAIQSLNNSMASGISGAIKGVLLYGKTWKDVTKDIAMQIASGIIDSIVSVGVQMATNFIISQAFAKKSAIVAASEGAATAAAWAPAAALSTLATSGGNALPAIAAIAAVGAIVAGLALSARATGGPVQAGKGFLVGERGPEAFFPSNSGTIVPNSGGVGGTIINIDARGSNGDKAVEEAVERGIRRASPQLISASVNKVQRSRQRDPNFLK
jgi:TP901 family phage tail tape measure protein